MKVEEQIIQALNELRPYLMNDGGDISFIKYDNGICYVKFHGACAFCSMQDFTLKDSIEMFIKDKVKEVKEVLLYNE